jgi:hypothetical protein
MADLFLNPKDVEDAEGELSRAQNEMMNSIDQTNTVLANAGDHLSGQTAAAWAEFQLLTTMQHDQLVDDFNQGTVALGTMRQLLIDADNNGAKRFH